jgi:hypothetical protein
VFKEQLVVHFDYRSVVPNGLLGNIPGKVGKLAWQFLPNLVDAKKPLHKL